MTLCPKVKQNIIRSVDTEMPLSTLARIYLNLNLEFHTLEAQISIDAQCPFLSKSQSLHGPLLNVSHAHTSTLNWNVHQIDWCCDGVVLKLQMVLNG